VIVTLDTAGAASTAEVEAPPAALPDKDAGAGAGEGEAPSEPSAPQPAKRRSAPRPTAAQAGGIGLVPAAPSVRRLARELGVDIHQVQGSGILGRISATDVRSVSEGGASAPAAGPAPVQLPDFSRWGEVERKAMSGIRKATVRTMAGAWSTVPMVTQFDKADSTEFERLRQRYKPQAEAMGAKLTPTAMLLKVVAAALKRFPDFNASIDTGSQEIVYKHYVNVGVAVDTEAGLLVPVIKNADRKNVLELAQELGELAEKARNRKLTPDDMQGGNFSVSNLGGIGGTGFTPIVNPPEVAILGVSRSAHEPVYNQASGQFDARLMMPLAVTYDHRLIDGAAAARFLRWICSAIEEPFLMALEG
jgi:pyruvate dehydrogenase E2 component (dihydrolipoamide acetyltransferase)